MADNLEIYTSKKAMRRLPVTGDTIRVFDTNGRNPEFYLGINKCDGTYELLDMRQGAFLVWNGKLDKMGQMVRMGGSQQSFIRGSEGYSKRIKLIEAVV
tara:strand:+ start:340 stop:636 length:297 start_codon:yes stop_codon:yes gene_type:complete